LTDINRDLAAERGEGGKASLNRPTAVTLGEKRPASSQQLEDRGGEEFAKFLGWGKDNFFSCRTVSGNLRGGGAGCARRKMVNWKGRILNTMHIEGRGGGNSFREMLGKAGVKKATRKSERIDYRPVHVGGGGGGGCFWGGFFGLGCGFLGGLGGGSFWFCVFWGYGGGGVGLCTVIGLGVRWFCVRMVGCGGGTITLVENGVSVG